MVREEEGCAVVFLEFGLRACEEGLGLCGGFAEDGDRVQEGGSVVC